MDAPPIQYARTEDGVNIAYWQLGSGTPLVLPNGAPMVGRSSWGLWGPVAPWFVERGFAPVAYDVRGSGLSDGTRDWSLDPLVADLTAVTRAAGPPAWVVGSMYLGPPCVAFAARFPELVTALVLVNTFARTAEYLDQPRIRTLLDLVRRDWEVAMETLPRIFWRSDEAETLEADLRAAGQDAFLEAFADLGEHDVSGTLASVSVRSVVLQSTAWPQGRPEHARELAAGIPHCELAMVDSDKISLPDDPGLLAALDAFIGDPVTPSGPSGLRTLLFTDLESSTALTQSVGDAKAQEVLRGHNDAVRAALEAHGGEEVKHTGDGIFAAFGSAVSAVEAALQIQRELAGAEVRVRVGLNAGEPIAEDHDYFGAAVQLAARVCDRAEPGQVLVSNVVKELCTGKLFSSRTRARRRSRASRSRCGCSWWGRGSDVHARRVCPDRGPDRAQFNLDDA